MNFGFDDARTRTHGRTTLLAKSLTQLKRLDCLTNIHDTYVSDTSLLNQNGQNNWRARLSLVIIVSPSLLQVPWETK